MERLRSHAKAILKNTNEEAIPWARMSVCSLATGTPLIFGLLRGELHLAIFGALIGYLIELNDHLGSLSHRLLIATLSFMILAASFTMGLSLHNHHTIFIVMVLTLTYWLGLMGGLGAETERLLLFSIIQMLVAFYSQKAFIDQIDPIFNYALTAYFMVAVGMTLTHFFFKKGVNLPYSSIKKSLHSSFTFKRLRHIYAISFTVTALIAIYCVEHFKIDRGYWTIITVMIIMKPDRKESIYRSLQRLLGTVLGIFLGEGLIMSVNQAEILIFIIMLSAFLIPYAMKRNYWLVSFLVSIVVIMLLSLPTLGHTDLHLPFVRLEATLYGCLLSFLGVSIFYIFSKILAHNHKQES